MNFLKSSVANKRRRRRLVHRKRGNQLICCVCVQSDLLNNTKCREFPCISTWMAPRRQRNTIMNTTNGRNHKRETQIYKNRVLKYDSGKKCQHFFLLSYKRTRIEYDGDFVSLPILMGGRRSVLKSVKINKLIKLCWGIHSKWNWHWQFGGRHPRSKRLKLKHLKPKRLKHSNARQWLKSNGLHSIRQNWDRLGDKRHGKRRRLPETIFGNYIQWLLCAR